MVERAASRAFLVGVVGRFSQGPLMQFFRFFFRRTFLPEKSFFFPRHPFCCFFLLGDLHLTPSPARHKPPPQTPLHTRVGYPDMYYGVLRNTRVIPAFFERCLQGVTCGMGARACSLRVEGYLNVLKR